MAITGVGGGQVNVPQVTQAAAPAPAAAAAPGAEQTQQAIEENMAMEQMAGGMLQNFGMDLMGESQKIDARNQQKQKERLAEMKKEG